MPRLVCVTLVCITFVAIKAYMHHPEEHRLLTDIGGFHRDDEGIGGEENNEESDVFNVGDLVEIGCEAGHVIMLDEVVYGNGETCGDTQAFDRVAELCEKKSKCSFYVTNDVFKHSDCPKDTQQMLMLDYECSSEDDEFDIPSLHIDEIGMGGLDDVRLSNDKCVEFKCTNGGVCLLTSDLEPACECISPWSGPHCEDMNEDLDEMFSEQL